MKKILFLGNSFTFYNDLPGILQKTVPQTETLWQFDSVTRGGAYLRQFTDPSDALSAQVRAKLAEGGWDGVVLQDQSFNPAADPEDTAKAAEKLAALFSCPIFLYQTWAYEDHSEKLAGTGLSYGEMADALRNGYARAAEAVGGAVVPVGSAFRYLHENAPELALYDAKDHYHPSLPGSYLAACCFAKRICGCDLRTLGIAEGIDAPTAEKLKNAADAVTD